MLLERERWQHPNAHELTCLACYVDELDTSSNVATHADLEATLW